MEIEELGEFGLIEKMAQKAGGIDGLVKGIGDDCAVLEGEENHLLLTTDMMVSGDHFNRDWHTPEQIGWKSMVVNVSDIAAMGGQPEWALVSIAIPDDVDVEYMNGIFDGIDEASEEYGLSVIGGDTTHGDIMVINVAVGGKVEDDDLSLRGDAEVADKIVVTGDLGKSWAGLELLRAGESGYTDFYLEPRCQLQKGRELAPHVNAMIDVSDGLASEVNHICDESRVGAVIEKGKVPISKRTQESAEKLDKDPYFWALSGGEDFELVFTIEEDELGSVEHLDPIIVGEIKEEGRYLLNGEKRELGGGYDHFKV